ncbi:MAG: DUF1989 domain-containing protein [Candidatus Baltobacteraceae bacterium]
MALPVSPAIVMLPAQSGAAGLLGRGARLRVVALHSEQVADIALFNAADPRDAFSAGRTIDYNESTRLACGTTLYSQRSTPIARVVEDTCGAHDMLLAPCSMEMFARRGQPAHPSCFTSLCRALREFAVDPDSLVATINVFMDVRVHRDGRVTIHPPPCRTGDMFTIEALTDLVFGISACSSELTNNGSCKPIAYEIRRAANGAPRALSVTPGSASAILPPEVEPR